MNRMIVMLAVTLAATVPALGFDADSQDVVDRFKSGKRLPIEDVATLMMGAERWCYNQKDDECGWSDVYLSTDATGATFEISNPWSDEVDISFVTEGEFRDGRFICENAFDWVPSVRAYERGDGWALEGRELAELKEEIYSLVTPANAADCFDYIYRGADETAQTITLTQRQFQDWSDEPQSEDTVTLHFDKDMAESLGWYW